MIANEASSIIDHDRVGVLDYGAAAIHLRAGHLDIQRARNAGQACASSAIPNLEVVVLAVFLRISLCSVAIERISDWTADTHLVLTTGVGSVVE